MSAVTLKAMFGRYPYTERFLNGDFASPAVKLDLAPVKAPQFAFKRAVRELEFDICELALVTFLLAKSKGAPLSLLPATLLARFQHPFLVYNAKRCDIRSPKDLERKLIGARSHTVTTVTWLRGILATDYGVDVSSFRWVTFEDAHVLGFDDPPGSVRGAEGKTLEGMIADGELDAAIVGAPVDHPDVKTVFADPAAEAAAWRKKHDAIHLNHLVVAKNDVIDANPDAVRDVYRQLHESRKATDVPTIDGYDMLPYGVDANRRNLEIVIDSVHRQGMIERRYSVDELFQDATRIP